MAADVNAIALVALNTNMAAAAGCLAATAVAWVVLGKPDLSMILNGTLAGLVAITAPCNVVTVAGAIAIGTIAGVLVVFAVLAFDKRKLDDPVGALSVHLVNGVWGTLAVGLFATDGGLFYRRRRRPAADPGEGHPGRRGASPSARSAVGLVRPQGRRSASA